MRFRTFKIAICIAASCAAVSGCRKKDEPRQDRTDLKRITLVYAVNNSSLRFDFNDDLKEMLAAMPEVDTKENRLIVYKTDTDAANGILDTTGIYEAREENGEWRFVRIREYERDVTSTSPERMSQVIRDVVSEYPDVSRTLVFWGHGTSWTFSDTDHKAKSGVIPGYTGGVADQSFGGEYGEGGLKWINIDELARAVPEGAFDVIWFDCCYMSSVEVAYQLRDRSRWLVAYPTEVWQGGMNYEKVLPLIMRATPDLVGGAKAFYNYYAARNEPVTVTVMDLDRIEPLAVAVSDVIRNYPYWPDVTRGVANYGRGYYFYDLAQLMDNRCHNDADDMKALEEALDDMIVYHNESSNNFDSRPWVRTPLCGISMHCYSGANTSANGYYRTLDWYRSVYE